MSSDDPEKAGLQPNYETSWEEIFQQVVKFILGKHIFVSNLSQRVVIQCRGVILGWISSVKRDDRQHVAIDDSCMVPVLEYALYWTVQASANPIRKRDIICLFNGASKPSIIRLCKDHFAVVVIAATPLNGTSLFEWPQVSQSKRQSLRNLLLVWDWGSSYGNMQNEREYKALTKQFSQVSVFSRVEAGGHLEKAARLWNDIAILDDLGECKEASERLIAAQDEYYLAAFGRMPWSYESESERGRTLLAFAAGRGHENVVKLLIDTGHHHANDGRSGQTPLWLAVRSGHEVVVRMLLATGQVEADSKDRWNCTPLSLAAKNGHEAIVKLLLATGQVDAESKDYYEQTPLSHAAREGHESVVKLLLATNQIDADSKDCYQQTPLSKAAKEGHESVVKLLIATDQVEVDSKDKTGWTPLFWAAWTGHEAVVKLLLATGQAEVDLKDEGGQTPFYWAAMGEHEAILKLILAAGRRQA
ncbi:hypothetical protein BOTNAR_0051g00250 [Botryotinia narcissicola]|uniref:Uncharacterized protein n=1 Tax=Botryotinia narcissicola TaxID=278944 RepID=A0A4Z1IZU2_9HELO|nr:hypothetical protein BOTNAR_0051g00250 [Botryotinia narcissicola]